LQQKYNTISTGTTDPGDVSVDLMPRGVVNGKFQIDFVINTHSVDLNQYDLTKITTLYIDNKAYYPEEAPKLEGHHSSGLIVFNTGKDSSSFSVKIKGIPKVEERVFEWRQ
jgi:hypothetical protein